MSMLKENEGLRSTSIYDVARVAGVSAVTVSRVYSGKAAVAEATRKRVLDTGKELGYRRNPLAAALRGASSHAVGILWSGRSSNIVTEITRSLQRSLEKRDYVAMAVDHFHEWKRTIALLEEMRSRAIDAIMIQAQEHLVTHPRVAAILDERPCVVVSNVPFDTPYDLVIHDRTEAYRQVVEHLLATGRKRLLCATSGAAGKWKLDILRQLLKAHGRSPNSLTILETGNYPDLSSSDGMWQTLCDLYPKGSKKRFDFDAIISDSDTRCVVIHRWLQQRGLSVPDDVAMIGSHDEPFSAYYDPPLASLNYRAEALAQAMERVLFERFENPGQPPIRVQVDMQFICRASAG